MKLFRGLSWKLTLSYTLVTVATWLVIEVLFIAGVSFLLISSDLIPGAMIYAIDSFIAPKVAEYLEHSEPDIDSMRGWMEQAFKDGITFESPENPNLSFHLGDLDQNAYISILDQNLNQLTGFPPVSEIEIEPDDKNVRDLVNAASVGDKTPERITEISGGYLTTAVPVFNTRDEVLGVILIKISYPPPGSLSQTLAFIGVSILLFTLSAGIVGTIFGYFTARGLTARLQNISSAAAAWSRGDFSAFIHDRSEDELGQLSGQLNRMAEQLQHLLKVKQDLAAMEERNRLARDLHDSVKQQVFATTMQIGAAKAVLDQDADETLKHMDQAEQLSRQAQAELGALITELRPVSLSDEGFLSSLEDFSTRWSQQNEIEVEFAVSQIPFIPQEIEQVLFRVAQEALANVSRHSEATNVKIELFEKDSEVILSINDNGIGFDVTEVSGAGMGLTNMSERLQSVGGDLDINTSVGDGTRIIARCPRAIGE